MQRELFNVARTRRAWSRNTDTKPNFHWHHLWWWFRAQASALQQATAFLGATNRDATTIPPVPIRRNTSTLNDTFTGDRRFTSSFVPQTLEGEGYFANLRRRMATRYRRASTFGTATNALDAPATLQLTMMRRDCRFGAHRDFRLCPQAG
jgi:hypothetical protein